jgi:outer membrane protein OmpA-like peptidoglycan-associated protein
MPLEHRRILRAVLSSLLLLGGALIALEIDDGTHNVNVSELSATVLDEPGLQLRFARQRLSLTTTTSSAAHEATLLQLVADQFEGVQAQSNFRPGLNVDPEWTEISARLILLVAATSSAEASIDTSGVAIRGVSSNGDEFQRRLASLNEVLLVGSVVATDVLISNPEFSLAAMCSRNFASISKQPIQFRQSSTTIRQSSYPLLDRLSEFAYDCRDPKIAITGHADATGEESWNVLVSRARAQAVADHLIASGVAAERLIIDGLGSQQPLAENDTVQGRERNRRIEIELRQL